MTPDDFGHNTNMTWQMTDAALNLPIDLCFNFLIWAS